MEGCWDREGGREGRERRLGREGGEGGKGGMSIPVLVLSIPVSLVEQCYHLQDTCYERRASGNRRKLNYAIFNIYTCFYVISSHYYRCHSPLCY